MWVLKVSDNTMESEYLLLPRVRAVAGCVPQAFKRVFLPSAFYSDSMSGSAANTFPSVERHAVGILYRVFVQFKII